MRHDLFKGPLPLAAGARTRTRIWPELARLLVVRFFGVEEAEATTGGLISTGEHDCGGHFFHGQIADVAAQLSSAGGATGKLGATRRTDQMASMTLQNWG